MVVVEVAVFFFFDSLDFENLLSFHSGQFDDELTIERANAIRIKVESPKYAAHDNVC